MVVLQELRRRRVALLPEEHRKILLEEVPFDYEAIGGKRGRDFESADTRDSKRFRVLDYASLAGDVVMSYSMVFDDLQKRTAMGPIVSDKFLSNMEMFVLKDIQSSIETVKEDLFGPAKKKWSAIVPKNDFRFIARLLCDETHFKRGPMRNCIPYNSALRDVMKLLKGKFSSEGSDPLPLRKGETVFKFWNSFLKHYGNAWFRGVKYADFKQFPRNEMALFRALTVSLAAALSLPSFGAMTLTAFVSTWIAGVGLIFGIDVIVPGDLCVLISKFATELVSALVYDSYSSAFFESGRESFEDLRRDQRNFGVYVDRNRVLGERLGNFLKRVENTLPYRIFGPAPRAFVLYTLYQKILPKTANKPLFFTAMHILHVEACQFIFTGDLLGQGSIKDTFARVFLFRIVPAMMAGYSVSGLPLAEYGVAYMAQAAVGALFETICKWIGEYFDTKWGRDTLKSLLVMIGSQAVSVVAIVAFSIWSIQNGFSADFEKFNPTVDSVNIINFLGYQATTAADLTPNSGSQRYVIPLSSFMAFAASWAIGTRLGVQLQYDLRQGAGLNSPSKIVQAFEAFKVFIVEKFPRPQSTLRLSTHGSYGQYYDYNEFGTPEEQLGRLFTDSSPVNPLGVADLARANMVVDSMALSANSDISKIIGRSGGGFWFARLAVAHVLYHKFGFGVINPLAASAAQAANDNMRRVIENGTYDIANIDLRPSRRGVFAVVETIDMSGLRSPFGSSSGERIKYRCSGLSAFYKRRCEASTIEFDRGAESEILMSGEDSNLFAAAGENFDFFSQTNSSSEAGLRVFVVSLLVAPGVVPSILEFRPSAEARDLGISVECSYLSPARSSTTQFKYGRSDTYRVDLVIRQICKDKPPAWATSAEEKFSLGFLCLKYVDGSPTNLFLREPDSDTGKTGKPRPTRFLVRRVGMCASVEEDTSPFEIVDPKEPASSSGQQQQQPPQVRVFASRPAPGENICRFGEELYFDAGAEKTRDLYITELFSGFITERLLSEVVSSELCAVSAQQPSGEDEDQEMPDVKKGGAREAIMNAIQLSKGKMLKSFIEDKVGLDPIRKTRLGKIWKLVNKDGNLAPDDVAQIRGYFAERIAQDLHTKGAIMDEAEKFLEEYSAVQAFGVLSRAYAPAGENDEVKGVIKSAFTSTFQGQFLENVYNEAFQECPAEALYIKIIMSD